MKALYKYNNISRSYFKCDQKIKDIVKNCNIKMFNTVVYASDLKPGKKN